MQKIRVALLWALAALPCLGQHTEVVVKRTEVVQVSNGDESPNLSQVNSVTIFYMSCSYVVYCGPPSADPSSGSTYTFASGSNQLLTASSVLGSGVFTPAGIPALPTSTIDTSTFNGVGSPSIPGWLSSSNPLLGTDVGQVLGSLGQQPTLLTGDQPVFSANGITLPTASDPYLTASAYLGFQPSMPGDSLHLNVPSWMTNGSALDSGSSLNTVIGGSQPSLSSDGVASTDAWHLILTASSSTAPVITSSPTLFGIPPLTAASFPSAITSGAGSLIGGLSAATGTSSESLNQQLESIKESGARIVSWSVLYDTSPIGNN